jgi:hypothetical protein
MVNGSQVTEGNSTASFAEVLKPSVAEMYLNSGIAMMGIDRVSAGFLIVAGVSIMVLFSALIMLSRVS